MTQAFNLSQLANNLNTSGQLDATDGLTGAVPVANGGTGQTSLSANAVILGNGTSGVQTVAPSTSGNVLVSNGTTWVSQAPSGGGVTSLNGQTGAITTTTFGNIGNTALVMLYSTSTFKISDTVSGSILYYPTSATYRSDSGYIVSSYTDGGQYTAIGFSTGSQTATPFRRVNGNTGFVAPLGCTTLSGTWRIVSLCGRSKSEYDSCSNRTGIDYSQVLAVRVS
jgi:hypothetical protein